jgi:type II secretory pathway component GspD/PulD (secretin)
VILEVRPRINTNRTVSLDVSQEVSRVAPSAGTTAGTDVNLTPTFTQRKITSRINITSGQTVVLGGLIQDSEIRTKDKIPVLGDVPVVGELFSSTSNSTTRTELIVFITPRIVRNAEDARDVSEELRARMRSLRPAGALPEAAAPPPEPAPGPMPLAPAAVIAPPTEELAPPAGIAPATEAPPAPERSRFDLARAPLPAARPAPPTPVPLARP